MRRFHVKRVCIWIRGSTDFKTNQKGLPRICKKKGCRGYFREGEKPFECFHPMHDVITEVSE